MTSPPLRRLREACGLTHERQVIRLALPPEAGDGGWLRDLETGRRYPFQRSAARSDHGFVEVALGAFEELSLVLDNSAPEPGDRGGQAACRADSPQTGLITNGVYSLEVPLGTGATAEDAAHESPGPVGRFRVGGGPWRGRTFLDTRRALREWRGEWIERGPVRVAYRFRAAFEREGFYEATITVDAGQPLAVIEERFAAGSGDQVVWDFAGDDLPEEFYLLDASAAYQTRRLFYDLDQRLTRMICWTQQSQHFDFSDGYALGFAPARSDEGTAAGRDIAGFVALEGGTWRGNKLNGLEAWTRRWFPNDPASRRNVPSEAKADSQPGPERIPARGQGVCEPHASIEGWIGHGRRKWALVLTTHDQIAPADPSGPPLGHFENDPDRPRYRRQQSLLRKVHTQRGLLPWQEIIDLDFDWETEYGAPSPFSYPNEVLGHHLPSAADPATARRELMDYLAARVYGFWEGSGSAFTNPVVSRRVAPEMYRYEWLARRGAFSAEERRTVRAWFAFLLGLFASENYYPGGATMLPLESPDSLDPTLAGMANQNFYTDVFNVPGTGAQVFWKHPRAGQWRALFIDRWHHQLAYHTYPESGVWEESHTYYHHVLHTVLPTLLRRRADGVDDEFANPAFQRLVGAEMRQLTPRDACFGGARHVVIYGDHGVEMERYRELWRELAGAIAPHDPALAGQLAWAYGEMGGVGALAVPAHPREPRNEYVQGLGVMFRGIGPAGHETLLALRSGNAWGHHHHDDGSLQFYAGGRAMIVDAAFGSVQTDGRRKFEAAGHSRWTLQNAEPVNYLWRFNRGWITQSSLAGPLAFATGCSPVILVRAEDYPAVQARIPGWHFRTVVQITPAAYLVLDTVDPEQAGKVIFHVAGGPDEVKTGAAGVAAAFPGHGGLCMLPLNRDDATPSRTLLDRPKSDEEAQRLVTTAVEYDVPGDAGFSAFLLAAHPPGGDAPEAVRSGAGWKLQGEGLEASVRWDGTRRVVIAHHRAGVMVREIDLRHFDNSVQDDRVR